MAEKEELSGLTLSDLLKRDFTPDLETNHDVIRAALEAEIDASCSGDNGTEFDSFDDRLGPEE